MHYSAIKARDVANGPGVRVSLFVSGCTHRCEGCFQPETWNFTHGQPFTDETIREILKLLEPDFVTGLTLLGGEPLEPENQPEILRLLRKVREIYPRKTVWCFTGYTLETDIWAKKLGPWDVTEKLLSCIDVLVDGEFILAKKNLSLRFRGSENQRLIDLKQSRRAGHVLLWDDETN